MLQVRGVEVVLLLPTPRPASGWHRALYDLYRHGPRYIIAFASDINITSAIIIIRRRSRSHHFIDHYSALLIPYARRRAATCGDAWQRFIGTWDAGGYWLRRYQTT